jgi:drug/metabolite transporter, DME family
MSYPVSGWAWLLHLGLIPTALGYLLFFTGMRHTTATAAGSTPLPAPLTSALPAWWLFDERLGLLGGTLLLGAMLLLYLPARIRHIGATTDVRAYLCLSCPGFICG